MRAAPPVALTALLAGAAPAYAAGGGEESGGLLWPIVNFALLVAVLVYFARKPIEAFFADRRASIERDLEEAAQLRAEAEERFSRWQRRLADLDAEIGRIREMTRQLAEAERERILEDATESAERIRRDASAAIDQEVRRSRAALRDEASALAVELAAQLLEERVTDDDRSRLIDEFIDRVASAPAGPDGGPR